jgi:2-oxoisovalerate dehydrogenase E2 component (dihydrolipoyl transacylase)
MADARPLRAPQLEGATGVVVFADGRVAWGQGFGAEGEAVGELCFNTAMTGYQEVMTDPSYAKQVITFTFPHIGNVGANDEDVEAGDAHALGAIVREAVTEPSNYRANQGFADWMAKWGRIGIAGVDTRALTQLVRREGPPTIAIAHRADGQFDLDRLQRQAAEWPGLEGMDLAKEGSRLQIERWTGGKWAWGQGYVDPPLPGREGSGVGAERSSASGIEPAAALPTPQSPPLQGGEAKAHVLASPAVRARARDLGIDLGQVKTASDRVRHSDLDAYLLYNGGTVPARSAAAPRADETIKVVGLRRKIAENMAEANRRIQHFTLVEEFDVTALEDTRAMMNQDRGANPKLTLLPFLITGLTRALAEWPMLNATFDDEAMAITRHGSVQMGVATQTANGLMVATIRDAQARSVWELAAEIVRLSEAARSNKATRDELTGATFTISSLGPMGGVASTPVVNPPQVAIVAVNKIEEKLVPVDGDIEIRKRMNLSLSCDHRVVDGWDAASFMQALKTYIENPLRLLST